MRLDAAVMGTCPTFINRSWKREGACEGRRAGWRRRGGERGCRGRREEVGLNKARIDAPNTAAGVS